MDVGPRRSSLARIENCVVRNALGAFRLRVMGQLFVEALVLSLVSGAVGIARAERPRSQAVPVTSKKSRRNQI